MRRTASCSPARLRRVSLRRGLALLAVALAAAGCASASGSGGASPSTLPGLGDVAPPPKGTPDGPLELSGTDPATGKPVSLDDYAGKPVVLNFWASWCPPCRKELPALMQLAREHPEIQVLGVNEDDGPGPARDFQRQIGFDWPSVFDHEKGIANRLAVIAMPTTFFLDAQHRIVGQVVGGADLKGFEAGVALAAGAQ